MAGDRHDVFWRTTRRLSGALLLVWLAVTVLVPWHARDAQQLSMFGMPLGYGATATGALLVYLAIVVVYSVAMDRLERQALQDVADAGDTSNPP